MGVRAQDGMEVLRRRQKGDTRTEIGETKKRGGNVIKVQCIPIQVE